MAAFLELIWSQNPKIEMAVSQKLFKIQIWEWKINKIRDQSAWDILDFRWNDMEWPRVDLRLYYTIIPLSVGD